MTKSATLFVETQIPKALLQQHSEAFSSMLDVGESREDKIVLQDSLEAFRDFRAMLFTCVAR